MGQIEEQKSEVLGHLNSNIKIDLHIHSIGSTKRDENLVPESTIDNLNILFDKLEEYGIGLFSFSDHNNFDKEIFMAAEEMISKREKKIVKNIIPGVELNVKFDDSPVDGQLNVYFDAKNENDLQKIQDVIAEKCCHIQKKEFLTEKQLIELISAIGLNVLIIPPQTKGKDHKKINGSATDMTRDFDNKFGYFFNGAEYQKPRVEGIFRNDLNRINMPYGLITGSDCHNWNIYPYHDEKTREEQMAEDPKKYFTSVKMLPNFRGLLFALSSPTTRIDRIINENNMNYIESIDINGEKILLDKSVNVFIGNNGSGKSALFQNILKDNSKINKVPEYYEKIKKINGLSFNNASQNLDITSISQNEITYKDSLIDDVVNELKLNINNDDFVKSVNSTIKVIKDVVQQNIDFDNQKIELNRFDFNVKILDDKPMFYPRIEKTKCYSKKDYEDVVTKIKSSIENIQDIISGLSKNLLKEDIETNEDIQNLNKVIEYLEFLNKKYSLKFYEEKAKERMFAKVDSLIGDKNKAMNSKRNAKEKELTNYRDSKDKINNKVKGFIKSKIAKEKNKNITYDAIRQEHLSTSGGIAVSKPDESGYEFEMHTKYHGITLEKGELIASIFNKNCEKFELITTDEELNDSINKQYISPEAKNGINEIIDAKKEKFINSYSKTNIIINNSYDSEKGSTPGEEAKIYIKYKLTKAENNNAIIMFDQPEDNISNKNINEIIETINAIRDEHQIIIITHNPLLAINLDADNIIFLEANKKTKKITPKFGCLEQVDPFDTTKLIIDEMEGGENAIKRRFKFYNSTEGL
ncbi:hypothetical protein [Mesoplasma lactucae]|uniref:Uncharacterized protein n=1 Tax=Mesoplasma lactucae ATCC 49193 TaxID=81460 RepID=A0A291IR44_9MOLU|nr:hypothetical protein [Mesoplasma lactucae]ATG97161.1 hypothetical protein CP520_00065 [Mesoplasma lactucae ATCC 49193]ATZ20399.1 hypothetical protein MLACT_v1c05780 [Mesoplasma lactucae ATCC 49193]MCL8216570.1 hypothetical protein [Mesoplasma lactucae ATCC 49193]